MANAANEDIKLYRLSLLAGHRQEILSIWLFLIGLSTSLPGFSDGPSSLRLPPSAPLCLGSWTKRSPATGLWEGLNDLKHGLNDCFIQIWPWQNPKKTTKSFIYLGLTIQNPSNQFFPQTSTGLSIQQLPGRQGELRQKDLELERLREELELLKVQAQEAQKLHSQLEIFKKRLEEIM